MDTFVCASADGWWYHPKHVEQFPDKINCVTLHLIGYILEYISVLIIRELICVQIALPAAGFSQCRSYTSMLNNVSLQNSGSLMHMFVITSEPVPRILQFFLQTFVRSLLPLGEVFCGKDGRARKVSAKAVRFKGK
jgi:hypothetical protein